MDETIQHLVSNERVHRRVYVDKQIFDQEMRSIFESTWIYCGHESQIPGAGDYFAFQIGTQPLLMVRQPDGEVRVLFNRCPHRGVQLCGNHSGNAGGVFVCPYHAWTFHLDGRLKGVPMPSGYENSAVLCGGPDFNMKSVSRVQTYRGFVFAALGFAAPPLMAFLGGARVAIDDMCDRSPQGEVEIVNVRHRVVQRSNWKLFMENQLDAVHALFTHESAGRAALAVETDIELRTGAVPTTYRPLSAIMVPMSSWDQYETAGFPYGHCLLSGYLGLRPRDPDQLEYEALMVARYGAEKTEEILWRNIHHVLVYPSLSVQPPMQQLRVIRPLAVDATLSEIWHFRLKGAPEGIYRRALNYFNLVNSPSTMVNADDLENWSRAQRGLASDGGDWVSFHRNLGEDIDLGAGAFRSTHGLSEAPMRHRFAAWKKYMLEHAVQ